MKSKYLALSAFLIIILASVPALCQQENDWQFDLAPFYLWAINVDGDLGIRGRTASASIDFSDVWDNLEGVFTLRFNAMYRNKFGILFDYNNLDLGREQATAAGNIEASFKSQIINFAGTYRLIDGQHSLDGVAGIRYTNLDAGIDIRNLGVSLGGDQDWVDPIVGLRYTYQLTDKWSLRFYGDIGGFGASSDFTWQGLGLIDFQPWKNVAFVAGYRGLGSDYETGSGIDQLTYDATIHGPLLGLDIRW